MEVKAQIAQFIDSHAEPTRSELRTLQALILKIMPGSQAWFFDGRDDNGKAVTNPNVGYGLHVIQYKGGATRDFYKVGFSTNTGGISVYIFGLEKNHLSQHFGKSIGKANVTSYCIKFKSLQHIHLDVLEAAIRSSLE
ncbi:MAG: DUF1801 domain-containing protein [Saprospiraceae bacterium]|nr:DUF1801 domain-containing protein [Saprospiraceae bacterium]HMW39666.1 DUF1801 domain-containing protein [Saprospiraceae bacterium]HMX88323.1 DUF1801 domain-containing protein [Saprospiraceae bacterium]HMZ40393.1 DUF1801 domain-containing protein [Saprospiraceae bacterium]HNA65409.1 DUF1801 domain-containing protein [Saprospiraceae bacterium]